MIEIFRDSYYPRWLIEEYQLNELVGISAPNLFAKLPDYPWQVCDNGRLVCVKIESFYTVNYDSFKPRLEDDTFGPVFVNNGEEALKEEFSRQIEGKTTGIISLVSVDNEKFHHRSTFD